MSRGLDLHREGDCDAWTCHFCQVEDERDRLRDELAGPDPEEARIQAEEDEANRLWDLEQAARLDTDTDDEQDDHEHNEGQGHP